MKNSYDHIKAGKSLRYFVYPPAILPDTAGFEDGLKGVCTEKIRELFGRSGELKRRAKRQAKTIKAKTKKGSVEEFFLKTFASHELAEYFVVKKWLRYWSKIWRKVNDKPLPPNFFNNKSRFGESELNRARQVPLEELYEGKLKKVGSRLVGLCPFHEEKTPSFYIFADNHFYCYGCTAHGDSISFVEKLKGLSFPETVRSLL